MNKPVLKKVGEVCRFVGGSQPPKSIFSSEMKDGYVRLIQIRDYKTDNFKTYIPKETTKKFCTKDDILIGRYGPPIFQILRGIEGAYNVALMKAIPKKDITNDYLYYFLTQKSLFEYINALSPRTGGQTGVDVPMLNEYPILLPEKSNQKQIAKVLSDLDAKIEVNNKINQQLEAMAKMVYDYWFVQFDFPMPEDYASSIGKPELAGKPYKTSGGRMVYNSELKREIPEGWEEGTILNCADLLGGGTPKKEIPKYWNGEIPFFTPTDTENNVFCLKTILYTNELGISSSSTKLFDKGTILITARGTVGKINIAGKPMAMNQSCYALKPKTNFSSEFIYFHTDQIVKYLKAKSSGSIFKAIVTNDFKFTPTIVPDVEIVKLYSKRISSMFETILNNKKQNQKLAELRDWLLPMLMNGQVRVAHSLEEGNPREAYDVVEDVVSGPDSYREAAERDGKYGEG
ncbi:MAG TPA: hypothetical protein DD462_06185 [Leeuwenhoekiella sp.]|jgi:type I restriction enzyme S subunit|nr:hypothetical protein [Leeuwenhoekiella sp.]|tara:strand:- start:8099 stop:9475 length:1377 start_codon:yes stop_codon:yes gene_type:complete